MVDMKNILILVLIAVISYSCTIKQQEKVKAEEDIYVFTKNETSEGPWITVEFQRGESFYYPLMAIWLEDMEGNFIQSLFVPESVATSVFRFGKTEGGEWKSGIRRWPQTLPYWAHKRNIKAADGLYVPGPDTRVPDAYSGPTPTTGFVMSARADDPVQTSIRVLLEVNQNWDWNEYWTNDLYPDDEYYKRSCQPAIVYEATINPEMPGKKTVMRAIGHSHPSGSTGELYDDLSTLTTALNIADSIYVYLGRKTLD